MARTPTDDDVKRMRELADRGYSAAQISKEVHFTSATVVDKLKTEGYIRQGNRWVRATEGATGEGSEAQPSSGEATETPPTQQPPAPTPTPPTPVVAPTRPAPRTYYQPQPVAPPPQMPVRGAPDPAEIMDDKDCPLMKSPERTAWLRRKRLVDMLQKAMMPSDNRKWVLTIWDQDDSVKNNPLSLQDVVSRQGGMDMTKAQFIVRAVFSVNEGSESMQPPFYGPYPPQQGQTYQYGSYWPPQTAQPPNPPYYQPYGSQWPPYPPQPAERPITEKDLVEAQEKARKDEHDRLEREHAFKEEQEERKALEKRTRELEEELTKLKRGEFEGATKGRFRIIEVPIPGEDGTPVRDPKTGEILYTKEYIPIEAQGPLTKEDITLAFVAALDKSKPKDDEAVKKAEEAKKEAEKKLEDEREKRHAAELKASEERQKQMFDELRNQAAQQHTEQMKRIEVDKAKYEGEDAGWDAGYKAGQGRQSTEEYLIASKQQDSRLKVMEEKSASIDRKFDKVLDFVLFGGAPPPQTQPPSDEAKEILQASKLKGR